MAKPLPNDKGFLILTVNLSDIINIDSPGICDWCSGDVTKGKYIAVLNHIYCDKCYDEWYERAKFYPEDRRIEEKNYNAYSIAFNGGQNN